MTDAQAMTDRAALVALRDAVREGNIAMSDLDAFVPVFGMTTQANDAHMAYRGSLDAALALHNALLPGWTVNSLHQARKPDNGMPPTGQWECLLFRYSPTIRHVSTKADTPARAWLLAILDARIAMEVASPAARDDA